VQEDPDERGGHERERSGDREARQPAGVMQGEREGQRGQYVADGADHRGDGDQRGIAARAEPAGDEAQHADERHGVAAAQQCTGGECSRIRGREGEDQLAEAHQHRRHDQHPARAIPVDEHSGRDLHGRVDADLQHDEHAELPGGDAEPLLGQEASYPERAAMEHGQEVDSDRDRPTANGGSSGVTAQGGRGGKAGHRASCWPARSR